MAIQAIKENVKLKLELEAGMKGDSPVIKSKVFTKVKAGVENEDLYQVALSLGSLQTLPVYGVKRLEEISLVEE